MDDGQPLFQGLSCYRPLGLRGGKTRERESVQIKGKEGMIAIYIEYVMRIGIQIERSGFEPFESWGLFLKALEKLWQKLRPAVLCTYS